LPYSHIRIRDMSVIRVPYRPDFDMGSFSRHARVNPWEEAITSVTRTLKRFNLDLAVPRPGRFALTSLLG
jgi:hypothetical protein